jgi:hypothetical protein
MEVLEEYVMDATTEVPREKLRQIIEKNGEAILQDSDRVEGLLRDHCGAYRKEISALVGALDERVPLELKSSWQTAMTPEAMRARLVRRLEDHRGLAPEVADWAVEAWSYALGIGLGRRSDRIDSVVLGSQANSVTGLGFGAVAGFEAGRVQSDAERQAAIASDRAGGAKAVAGAGLLATVEQKKKAGIGVAAVLLVAAAVAFSRHQPPQPPVPIVVPGDSKITPKPAPTDPIKKDDPIPAAPTGLVAGTPVEIRLNQGINSDETQVGQTFTATLATPLMLNGKTMLPQGADATVRVMGIDPGGKVTGRTVMQLELVELVSGSRHYKVATAFFPIMGPQQTVEAAKRTGIGGAVGAAGGFLVGKVFHRGGTGAVTGAVAGGTVGAVTTKPKPAKAEAEKLIKFRLTKTLAIGS